MALTITLSNQTLLETAPIGTIIGTLGVEGAKPDAKISFSGAQNDWVEIKYQASTGLYHLVTKVEGSTFFDYETESLKQFVVSLAVEDFKSGETTDNIPFTIVVTDDVSDNYNVINGTSKNDKINGTADADAIYGGKGNDKIKGLGGDDLINGGAGKDILTGGAGKDTFVFDTPVKKGQFDQITDFKSSDDTIQISLSALKAFKVKVAKEEVFDSLEGTKAGKKKGLYSLDKVFEKGKLEKKFFTTGKAKDSYDFVTYDKKTGFVYLDLDGSGGGKGFAIAKLKPGTSLSADDFLFV
jgi:serralysin